MEKCDSNFWGTIKEYSNVIIISNHFPSKKSAPPLERFFMDFLPKNYYHDGISTGGIEDFLSWQILVPWELGFGNDCAIRNLSSGIYIYTMF